MKTRFLKALLSCAVIAVTLWIAVPAQASMLIMPVRIYFVDGERMKTLTVLNKGSEQAVFRIEMQHKKQLPEGGYLNLTEPLVSGYDPSKWLVYSPRQVSLEGQAKQSIRLSLRRPAELPDGEYRVHMALDRIARGSIEGRNAAEQDKIVPQMFLNIGFAIPVIVRKGRNDTIATINSYKLLPPDVKSNDKRNRMEVDISRQGKYSSVGELTVYWTPAGGDEVLIGQQKAMIIYPELAGRATTVMLNQAPQGGKIRISYIGTEVDAGKTFDEKVFTAQ